MQHSAAQQQQQLQLQMEVELELRKSGSKWPEIIFDRDFNLQWQHIVASIELYLDRYI